MQITDQQTEIRRLRDELIAAQSRLVEHQFVIDDHAAIRERERTQDQRSIRTAVGLLDRILDETRNLNQVRIYFAVTGRCWHHRHDCNGLNNANQVEERYACSFCLASLPPYEVHPDTGTTFWQDCEELKIILPYEFYPSEIVIHYYRLYCIYYGLLYYMNISILDYNIPFTIYPFILFIPISN